MFGFGRRLRRSGETIRKYFALTGCAVPVELLKNYVVAALRVWRPVPRPVKGDENAIAIVRRKLLLVVQDHGVWRPMRRKCRNRSNLARAYADGFDAIATVFRREDQLFHERIVVALGPAIVSLRFQQQQLFSRKSGLLVGFIQVGPICV